MKLSQFMAHPEASKRALERYVNDGSISGFTELNTTSEPTRPFGDSASFTLMALPAGRGEIVELGDRAACAGEILSVVDGGRIPVHPDMTAYGALVAEQLSSTDILVSPTSSGRTVDLLSGAGYVKLSYSALLGRVDRTLAMSHARASIALTAVLSQLVVTDPHLDGLSIFREPYAACLTAGGNDIGFVFRERTPFGVDERATRNLIPFFSLFSRDRRAPEDPTLLAQLVNETGVDATDFIVGAIIEPLIRYYFTLVKRAGLIPEMHAQNLLLGVGDDLSVTTIALRDLESTDVDVTVRDSLGLPALGFEPYKHIDSGQYNYQIKHSFMYDFKLGEYVLEPVIRLARDQLGVDPSRLYDAARLTAKTYTQDLAPEFFPATAYGVSNTIFDRKHSERPYIELGAPKYR